MTLGENKHSEIKYKLNYRKFENELLNVPYNTYSDICKITWDYIHLRINPINSFNSTISNLHNVIL